MTRDTFFKGLLYLLMALAAAAVMFSYIGTLQLQSEVSRQQAVVKCQLTYADQFQRAIAVRDNANRVIREAQITLLKAAAGPSETDPTIIRVNIQALEHANQFIREHPLPKINFCDGAY